MIIPNWNGASRLKTLFRSLKTQEPIEEIIVIDNGSTDNSVAVARQAGARVIAVDRNEGFAPAVNRGVRSAVGHWLAVINNDVEVESGWLKTLLSSAIASSAWFATGKLLDNARRSRIDGTFDAVCRGGTAWRCGSGRLDGPAFNVETQIQFAPFTAVLLKKELFDKVGLLDERFESYLEDVDFGLRCAKHGLSGIYVPSAIGYHQGSATFGRWHPDTVRRISRNQLLLVAKHIGHYGWPVIVAQGLWGLVALRHGAAWPWLKGKLDGVRLIRRSPEQPAEDLSEVFLRSERQIKDLQRETGFDLYWKLYFALT